MRLMAAIKDVGAFLGILLIRLSGREPTLIVGDSHAVILGGGNLASSRRIQRARSAGAAYIIWLGPKLLYSVAHKGFPSWARALMSGAPSRIAGAAGVRLELVLGEIDVRCHLAPRLRCDGPTAVEQLGDAYVAFLGSCIRNPAVLEICYHEPTPPSDLGMQNEAFPRAGTLAERIECHRLLSNRIAAGIETHFCNDSRVRFVPTPPGAKLVDGSLSPGWTDDGCHFNRAALVAINGAESR